MKFFSERIPMDTELVRIAVTDMYVDQHYPGAIATSMLNVAGAILVDDVACADITIFNRAGRQHLKAGGLTIALSTEPHFTQYPADYSVDCRYLARETHLRLPYWAYRALSASEQVDVRSPDSTPHRFCNFIYSNGTCAIRNAFFEMLNARKPVDSLGKVMHNFSDPRLAKRLSPEAFSSKRDVLADYRFTIAFENSELPGYTTEKMIDAWLAGSVPIYWGDPAFTRDFPPESCLSLYQAGSLHTLVEQVLEAEHEPARYAQLQAANPFRTGHGQMVLAAYQRDVDTFAGRVIDRVRTSPPQRTTARRVRARNRIRNRVVIPLRMKLRTLMGLAPK